MGCYCKSWSEENHEKTCRSLGGRKRKGPGCWLGYSVMGSRGLGMVSLELESVQL